MLLHDLTRRRYHFVTFQPGMGEKKVRAQATYGVLSCFNFGSGLFYYLYMNRLRLVILVTVE